MRALEGVSSVAEALLLAADGLAERIGPVVPDADLLAPLDRQEVWGAGVTYVRSRTARMDESRGAAAFYDLAYDAERPELFFKATPSRVAGPGQPIRVRRDSRWTVPEPEIALWLDSDLELRGIGLGNDVSARDIEGENPLYLPQAKVYAGCCALGPAVWAQSRFDEIDALEVSLRIRRDGACLYEAAAPASALKRSAAELVAFLGRDNVFPDGVVLLTGTGIVPPDDIALRGGDEVEIAAAPIEPLINPVLGGPA